MSTPISITSLVYNAPYAKQLGLPPFYYRYRSCNPNFPNRTQTSVSGFTPAEQYQKQKIMQKTVRVPGSLYTSNLGSLSADGQRSHGVSWNQMSDRPVPSVQRATVPTGQHSSMNKRHSSVTSNKPGSQTPGGVGCDIKHNSYDRYLNRLKGKGLLKRGAVHPPAPFNPAFPVYGGKTYKTSIVSGCACPLDKPILEEDVLVFRNPRFMEYPVSEYKFDVGAQVYVLPTGQSFYKRATITQVSENGIYFIQFEDGEVQEVFDVSELLPYNPCDCGIDTPSFSEKALSIACLNEWNRNNI
jgi:hypothetical protein